MLKLYDLSINAVKNPAYAPCKDLYIGWKLDSDNTNVLQTAYTASITQVGGETPIWAGEGTTKAIHIPVDAVLSSRTEYVLTVTNRVNFNFFTLNIFVNKNWLVGIYFNGSF